LHSRYIRICIGAFFALLLCSHSYAQNLAPNPSFEDYNNCPTGISGIGFSTYPTVKDWLSPVQNTTPDYLHTCAHPLSGVHVPEVTFGHQWPRTGNGYSGIILWEERTNGQKFAEYLQTKLIMPMVAGRKYCVTFYVNPAISSSLSFNYMAVDEIGANFSSTQINTTSNSWLALPYHIQSPSGSFMSDTAAWIRVTGIYTANGGEEWLTIGRFSSSGNKPNHTVAHPPTPNPTLDYRAYVYVDDVSVYMITPADTFRARHDSIYCDKARLPMMLKSRGINGTYSWSTGATTDNIVVNADGQYICYSVAGCAVFIDTFNVKYLAESTLNLGKELVSCNMQPVNIKANILFGTYTWSTGATTPDVTVNHPGTYWLRMVNACGTFTDTVRVYIQAPTAPPVVRDTMLCQLTEGPILKNVTGSNLHWYTHPAATIGSPVQPLIYSKEIGRTTLYVTQKIGKCESEKVPMNIDVKYQPKKELPIKTEMCSYNLVMVGNEYPGVKYLWNNGSTACCVKPVREGMLRVSVSNECGTYIDSTRVVFLPCDECIHVPNAFSPNGDGMNDKFGVVLTCPILSYHLRIYNRWGEQVFESKDVRHQWTGTETGLYADRGTYVYILDYVPESNGAPIRLKGNVTLLR